VEVFHADCLIDRVRQREWGSYSPLGCDLCARHFLGDIPRWAFRLKLGSVDFQTSFFVAEEASNNEAILCPECLEEELGEGCGEEGRLLLGTG
jgi:hypothetical protein